MAGFRKNIDKEIQTGLDARVDALSKYGDSSPLRSPLLNPVENTDFSLTYEEQVSKSPFIRMIAPGEKQTHVLYGMFNANDLTNVQLGASDSSVDFFASQADRLEGGAEQNYYGTMNSDSDGNINSDALKPKPGIVSAEIQFLKFGGAVRKATVSWTCWTLDQLSKFQKGSFLSSGRNVILDWGWVRANKTQTIAIPQLLAVEGNSVKLDDRLFKRTTKTADGGRVELDSQAPWQNLYKTQYGDWSGLIGVISKFSYTQREDGGFDCTTEILARGTNIFEKPIAQPKNEAGLGFSGDSSPKFTDLMEDIVSSVIEDGSPSEDILKLTGPSLNIGERIATLDLEILMKVFSKEVDTVGKDPIAVLSSDKNIAAILSPSTEGGSGIELYEKGVEGIDEDPEKLKRVKDYGSDIWVRWGWFEDVILNYYASNEIEKESGLRQAEFRSIERNGNKLVSVKIRNDDELYTYDPSTFILPGQFPVSFHPTPDKERDINPYKKLAEVMSDCPAFSAGQSADSSVPTATTGYLRNIYINLGHLQSIFKSPGTSMTSAMLRLADSLNSKINIWNFSLQDADGITTATKTFSIVDEGVEKTSEEEETDSPKQSYVFENFGFNSIVTQVDLQATLPDKFAVAAGYGASKDEGLSDDLIARRQNKIKNLLKSDDTQKTERTAEELGRFFSDPSNRSTIASIKRMPYNVDFGPTGDSGETDLGELTDEGLRGSGFNHEIPKEIMEITPTANVDYMEKFNEKYKDSLSREDVKIKLTKDGEEISLGRGAVAIGTFDPNDDSIMVEYRKPYNLNGKMRDHFIQSMRWYLEKSPLTRIDSTPKTLILPLSLSMTLEGCGGLFPGHMFRIAYAPEVYGQVDFEIDPELGVDADFNPNSFFHIQNLSHTIDENGWSTSIEAQLNKNNEPEKIRELSDEERLKAMKKVKEAYRGNINKYKEPKSTR